MDALTTTPSATRSGSCLEEASVKPSSKTGDGGPVNICWTIELKALGPRSNQSR